MGNDVEGSNGVTNENDVEVEGSKGVTTSRLIVDAATALDFLSDQSDAVYPVYREGKSPKDPVWTEMSGVFDIGRGILQLFPDRQSLVDKKPAAVYDWNKLTQFQLDRASQGQGHKAQEKENEAKEKENEAKKNEQAMSVDTAEEPLIYG